MGWCSGTDIFDHMAYVILDSHLSRNLSPLDKKNILYEMAMALENLDWDCQTDSRYWDHPTVRMAMQALHPDWDWDNE